MSDIRLGPCNEKVGHIDIVEKQLVSEDMATKTWIKWLIKGDDGAPTFVMRLFTVESGGYIKPHHHPWEHEIYVLKGIGEIRIGSRIYRVTTGSFLLIPPNVEHEYRNIGKEDLEFLCMIPLKPSVSESTKKRC